MAFDTVAFCLKPNLLQTKTSCSQELVFYSDLKDRTYVITQFLIQQNDKYFS